MALSTATTWEVRTDGSDNNGGGFKTGSTGTDRSQSSAAWSTITTLSVVGSTTTELVISLTDYTVSTSDVGNLYQNNGGTASTGWFEITAVSTSLNRWTVDRSAGSSAATLTGFMGGAMATPGRTAGIAVVDNKIYIRAGTYIINSTVVNTSSGIVSSTVRQRWVGYNSSRGDLGTPPLLQSSNITSTLMFSCANDTVIQNLNLDGAGLTSLRGFTMGNRGTIDRCQVANFTNSGFNVAAGGTVMGCAASSCTTAGAYIGAGVFYACVATKCTATPFQTGGAGGDFNCVASSNTGGTTDGFAPAGNGTPVINCVAYANGRHGFSFNIGGQTINCIAENNGGWGYNATANSGQYLLNCAAFNNTSGAVNSSAAVSNFGEIAGTGTFFTNAAADDFSLNNTAGGGAAVRAAGFPGKFLVISSTGALDIGAVQHADPASAPPSAPVAIFSGA